MHTTKQLNFHIKYKTHIFATLFHLIQLIVLSCMRVFGLILLFAHKSSSKQWNYYY